MTREVVKAADIWQNGIARDLAQQVGETLHKAVGKAKRPRRRHLRHEAAPADGRRRLTAAN